MRRGNNCLGGEKENEDAKLRKSWASDSGYFLGHCNRSVGICVKPHFSFFSGANPE